MKIRDFRELRPRNLVEGIGSNHHEETHRPQSICNKDPQPTLRALAGQNLRTLAPIDQMSSTQIGQTIRLDISARSPWNDSGIDLISGGRYDFIVPGDQKWKDASIECDADGYRSRFPLKAFEPFRRVPDQNYFKLIGTIGRSSEEPIVIGSRLEDFSAWKSGRLYCFANDVRIMYWNNSGSIGLNLTRRA